MNFWVGLSLVIGLHVFVNVWMQPRVEQRWRAGPAHQMVAKAGTLAALQTAGDFLRIAAMTFSAIAALFLVLQWVAPATTLGVLSEVQSAALAARQWAKAAGGWIGQILFWIGIAGAFAVIWALTLDAYRQTLAVEYFRQLRALVLDERKGVLQAQPVTADMRAASAEIAALGPAATDHERQRLAHRLRYLDLVRRIDLGKQGLSLEARGTTARLLRLLFSEGMVDIGKNNSKRLGKIAAAATCVLLLGTASPALRSDVIEPAIDTLAGLRIERELADSKAQLRALAGTPPVPVAKDDPDYRAAAEQFLDALSDSNGWTQVAVRLADRTILPDGESRMFDTAFDRMVARDAVVRSYAVDPSNRTRPFAFEDLPEDDPGRRVLEAMRLREAGPSALRARAVERLEQAFRKAGASVPGFREKLKTSLGAFDRPARLSTFATMALSDQFALAVSTALPGSGGGAVFEAEAVRAEQKGLQKSFEQIVQVRFSAFLRDITAGKPLGTALRRVQGDGLDQLLTRSDAARLSRMLDSADTRRNAFLMRGFERPAVLAAAVTPAEAKAVSKVLEGPDWQTAMPLVAKYDDLLPGTAMALPTSLAVAAARYDRPRETIMLRSAQSGAGGRVSKIKPRGASLLGLALTAASFAAATEATADTSNLFEAKGITVNQSAAASGYDVKNLSWQLSSGGLQLRGTEIKERLLPAGRVDPAVARAALALAADGRPAALIASPINRLGWTRWLLHPVIEDTRIGAELITLYRKAPGTPELGVLMTQTSRFGGLAVVKQAGTLGVSRETRDFLALAAIFRSAFRGQLSVEASALVQLARQLEPYRLALAPTPRLSLRPGTVGETRR